MHVIGLIEPSSNDTPVYQSGRSRYSTATDVVFITSTLIVACHRNACKVYLIKLMEDNTYEILDTLVTTYKGENIKTEMITYANKKLYMTTMTDVMIVMNIVDNKIIIEEYVKLLKQNTYHGLQSQGGYLYITPNNAVSPLTERIIKYDMINKTYTAIHSPDLLQKHLIKDITFLPGGYVLLLIVFKKDTNMCMTNHVNDGMIMLLNKSFRIQDKIMMPKTHIDSIIAKDNTFYFTCSNEKGGFIRKGQVKDGKFVGNLETFNAADFPHGIDICGNKLAYTSYTDSTVCIMDI
jgi:hypothetical protein